MNMHIMKGGRIISPPFNAADATDDAIMTFTIGETTTLGGCGIFTDDKNISLFTVPNEYDNGNFSFKYRPADAISTIKQGYAHDIIDDSCVYVFDRDKLSPGSCVDTILRNITIAYSHYAYIQLNGDMYVFMFDGDHGSCFKHVSSVSSYDTELTLIADTNEDNLRGYIMNMGCKYNFISANSKFGTAQCSMMSIDDMEIKFGQVLVFPPTKQLIGPLQSVEKQVNDYLSCYMDYKK